MKLKTKLTALCAVLLLGVAVSLTAAMLWQVREQSYSTLLQNYRNNGRFGLLLFKKYL